MDCSLLWWQQLAEKSHRACSSGEYSRVSSSVMLNWNRSMYYPAIALPNTTYKTHINSCMVWHLAAILIELLHKRCRSQPDNILYSLECKMRFLSFNLALKNVRLSYICAWSTEPDSAKPDHSELDHAETNQGLHHQNIIQICALSRYYATQSGNSMPTFRETYQSHVQESRNPNREHSTNEVNWHDLLWDFAYHIIIRSMTYWKLALFLFQAKKHLMWWTTRLSYSQSLGTTETVTFKICTWEQS
jgi:hypothetical protein